MPDALPNSIATYLHRVVVRRRFRRMLAGVLWAAAVFGAWGLLACAIDRYVHLTAESRIGILAAGAAVSAGVLLWPIRKWGRRVDWVAVAAVVEAYRPGFAQRLVTITSRLMGPVAHRGSPEMIAQLLAEVEQQIAKNPSPAIGSAMRELARPMAACAIVIGAAAGMLRAPGMELPRLAERFALPWRPAPAVTTTRLLVQPDSDSELTDSTATELRVEVSADRLPDGVVSLFTEPAEGSVGEGWSRLTMDQLSPGRFEYVFAGIDRDMRYYVAGGDAVSRVYSVRLMRKPAVAAFHIRYRYPSYVRSAAAEVVNTDGLIEAPVGTQADVTIAATEALQSATLRIGSRKIIMHPSADPMMYSATIPVATDEPYALEMISTRDVAGSGPKSGMRIRAILNRPPMLRLTDASGEPGAMLSVNPRQVLPVAFEAEDDFGLSGLSLRWQIEGRQGGHGGQLAVAIPDGVRHIQDAVDLDLAALPMRVGDVLRVWLEVHDTSGQKATSQPIEALMAAKPVDAETRQRLAALDAAAAFADRLVEHLSAALPRPPSTQPGAPADRGEPSAEDVSAALSSATEDAGLLRQSLLRAIAHGATGQSAMALAGWVDSATLQSYWADRLFQQLGDQSQLDAGANGRLAENAAAARSMRDDLKTVDQGWWAQVSLAEWQDVNNSTRHSGVLARVRQDAVDDARTAGCADGAGLPIRLAGKVALADMVMAGRGPVDFVPPAERWAHDLATDPQAHPSLSPRLRSAAEAEALRQNGDLSAARDLELSSRAAEALEAMAAARSADGALAAYVSALSALQREQRMNAAANPPPASEQKFIHNAAAAARKQMARWTQPPAGQPDHVAGGPHAPAPANPVLPDVAARSAESAAIAAAAESAQHIPPATRPGAPPLASTPPTALPFAAAPASAAQMHGNLTVTQKLAAAQQIDAIDQRQQDLLRQTSAATPREAPVLAQRQQQVADSIDTVAAGQEPAAVSDDDGGTTNARQREAAALLAIGQQLAAMPQQLATAQDALADASAAAAHAQAAQMELQRLMRTHGAASNDLIRAAQRAAQQSSADSGDAARRLAQSTQPVSAAAGREMAQQLEPFAPEASVAKSAVTDQLVPALAGFEKAIRSGDVGGADRAAGSVRNAIGNVQEALADAQNALADRDPLVTASSSARAAVASLRRSPPDFSTAVRHQTQATLALSRAWDQSIHGAAAQRLAAVPGLQPLFAPGAVPVMAGGNDSGAPLAAQVAQGRQWGRLQGQGGDATGSTSGDNADPPGFEDALRLYFEALGRAQNQGK